MTNGGVVVSLSGALGNNVSSSNNVALVSGTGSVWNAGGTFYVGSDGAGNQLIVNDGGTLVNVNGTLGLNSSSSNNVAVVTAPAGLEQYHQPLHRRIRCGQPVDRDQRWYGGVRSFGILGDNASSSNNVALISGPARSSAPAARSTSAPPAGATS